MGVLMQNDSFVGGIDSSLVNKIGTASLDTVAQDLSGAVNELKATGGGGNVDDVYVNGVSVLDSNKIAQIDLTGKVNTTGDTMTGNLIINNATAGAVQITNPNTDLREADNNVSSAQFNQFRIVDDGSHMTMGYFGTTVYPEGLVQGTLQVSNFDTNGDPVSNGISLTVDKDGSKSYSVSDEAAFRRAIGVVNRAAANAGADLSLVTTGDKYTWNNKVDKSGDTMTGALNMAGVDINLKTSGSSSDDSSDIVWYYGNGQEKARLWTENTYTSESGLNFRMYKSDGTNLFSGKIPLRDTNTTYTLSVDSNNIKLTPSSGTANSITVPYATSSTSSDYLSTYALNGSSDLNCLQTGFSTIPKSVGTAARLQRGGHAMAFGWFLSGYDYAHAYGGWFISDYDTPRWIGVSNGTWRNDLFATSGNVSTGDNNGQIKIAGSNISVKGLGSMAYQNTGSWQPALSSSAGSLSVTYNSTNAITNNDMWYAKYGNVVQLCGSVKNKKAITIPSHGDQGDLHMFTLPSGYHPKITTGGFADNGNLVAWRIASDGKVYLTSVFRSTGTWAAGAVLGIRATFIV